MFKNHSVNLLWYLFVFLINLNAFLCTTDTEYKIVEYSQPTNEAPYEPTWDSLDSRPLPKWYQNAKVGIFLHWGVYSVPSFGSEWFWTNWRNSHIPQYVNYMKKNYKPGFTYQEFANEFTAEHFDPKEWASIFEESGAKYVYNTIRYIYKKIKVLFFLLNFRFSNGFTKNNYTDKINKHNIIFVR